MASLSESVALSKLESALELVKGLSTLESELELVKGLSTWLELHEVSSEFDHSMERKDVDSFDEV
jgi:hypothetical protein